jgi:nicotinamidase/pyrazinamidase
MQGIMLPEKKYVASFDVHAQNTFTPLCPQELPVAEGDEIVDELNAQAKMAGARIGSKEAHSPRAVWVANENQPVLAPIKGQHVDVAWPVHSVPGTFGFELIAGLPHPTDYNYFVWEGIELDMHPYGACYHDLGERLSTGVIEFLRSRQITTVIVGGLALDYCVKTTVLQLLRAGFQVIVNLAACRGLAQATSEIALSEMKNQGAQFVENASALKTSKI